MCSRKWLIVALVVCGLVSACSDYNTNLSIQTSSSVLTFVSPSTATVGGQGFTITANGGGFVTGALILWNGSPLTTTLVSSAQLTAPVPATDLTTAGTVRVAVQIPGSAQSATSNVNNTTTTEVSNVVLFTVGASPGTPPAIASLSPVSAPFCSSPTGFKLTVAAATGTTFTSDSVVNWNGSPRATVVTSSTQLTATILPTDTASSGTAVVSASNSAGSSNTLPFTMSSPTANLVGPQAILSLVQPPATPTAFVGSPAIILTVTGGNFLPCSVVQWVNSGNVTTSLATTYVSATQLGATVPASNFLAAGTAQVVVFTPGPGGGTTFTSPASTAATFTITQPPAPTISSLSSSTTLSNTTPYCSPAGFTLTVNGTNFANGSVVNWNGSPRPTSFVLPAAAAGSPTPAPILTAIIPFSDTATQGTLPIAASITVSNGSAVSNSLPLSVTAPSANFPVPAATSLSPASAAIGSAAFNLVVTGSNFQPCSVVQWNGTAQATNYLSSTQLSTFIPAADILTAATAQVTVFTPAPGGGTSTPSLAFSILVPTITSLSASTTQMASTPYCSPTGFTLLVTGTNFVNGLVVNWNGSPRPTTFVSATQLSAEITYADTASLGTATVFVSGAAISSNSLTFTMTSPASFPVPSISSLMPANAAAGSGAFALSVMGNNLLPCTVVQWNGSARSTTFVGPNGVTAPIAAADIAAVGNVPVTVITPAPSGCTVGNGITCGGTSNASTFTVFTPVAPAARTAATAQLAGSAGSGTERLLSLPLLSSDHRYAVHVLASTDGATEIPGTAQNIFVRDTCLGAPSGCTPSETLASIGLSSNPADGGSISPAISADGRYVTFLSPAMNLVDSDTNGVADVFVRDTCTGAASGCTPSTWRVSVATDGTQANAASTSATISATGRYVTFQSPATNLGSASSSALGFFLRDTCAGAAASCTPSTQPLP